MLASHEEGNFLDELGFKSAVAEEGSRPKAVQFLPFVPQLSLLSSVEWGQRLFLKARKLRGGNAAGPDYVPPEVLK